MCITFVCICVYLLIPCCPPPILNTIYTHSYIISLLTYIGALSRINNEHIVNIYGSGNVVSKQDASILRPFIVLEALNG